MRSLQEAIGRELTWKPRSLLSHTHDLVDPQSGDAEPWATLAWRAGLLMRAPAEAQSGDGIWHFRRRGFFRENVLVFAPDGTTPVATLKRSWRHGTLRFEDGREFTWRREAFWRLSWRFEDANGNAVVRLHWRFSLPRSTARVEFESSAAPVGDLALLACLGWYLVLLSHRRAVAHGAS
ncbi:MAG: hypothetical protein E4H17_04365 [Gemmatimonadales bacterium]|nr:MAG: hypothetical protein E4H17_04365 [Gemmatimonadales bacterium]